MVLLGEFRRLGVPRRVWLLQIGTALSAFGTGSVFPFLLLYLSRDRGFSISLAGLLVGLIAVSGMLTTPIAGALIDRWGPKRVLAADLLMLAVATFGYTRVEEPWHAAVLAVFVGFGNACLWPSNALLTAGMLGAGRPHIAFAVERTAANLGLGLGALSGGLLATIVGYAAVFVVDAASFLIFFVLVLRFAASPPVTPRQAPPISSLRLLAVRPLRRMLFLKFAMTLAGFGPFELIAVFARERVQVTEGWIGVVFLANTAVIVACQLPLTRAMEGRRRMIVLATVACLWATAWGMIAVTGVSFTGVAAALALMVAAALFAVGEALQSPAQDPLFLGLAPDGSRGRAMALSSTVFQAGLGLGPAAGGWLVENHPEALWPIASVLALSTGVLALWWERGIPRELRRTARPDKPSSPKVPERPREPVAAGASADL